MKSIDVVVVGAGPVGLLTAIELTLAGASVLVLERLATPSPAMKAMALGPLACEALQRRGMGAAIAGEEARNLAVMQQFTEQNGADWRARMGKYSGHFAGLLIRKDAQREPQRRVRAVNQQGLEAMLGERARALGIDVRRECDVTGLEADDDGVTVTWASPAGEQRLRCAYLVGCDGGRSPVRKMAGFAFPGTAPTTTFYQVMADIDHPERLLPLGWRRTPRGVFSYGPVPGRLFMLDFSRAPENREAPVTREEVEALLRHISDADVRVTALESGSRWADNTRLVDTYRQGRVLLAGDAAHVHSPFGGQGLSLGLLDATNLGWKLAAVIRGEMPDSLLDTYTAERRPVAEAVLANTLAQAALLRPDPQSGAMRELMTELMQVDDVNQRISDMVRGLSTRYDLGTTHDDVGQLASDLHLGDSTASLYDLMQEGTGVLLDATSGNAASALAQASTQRVHCVAVDQGPSMLIRPDACIAWVNAEATTHGLPEALLRWFRRGD
ncbi:FAD-dependent monooxygenase [Dyella sp. C11]|uniref:FAD-dependent monooxygenase n=1 Tax=Dyella sp. C11 TaxID=2126991 RepID=UPI000D6541A8|nr:FAD-dependent monooxygenase [Dyella sp. C11]